MHPVSNLWTSTTISLRPSKMTLKPKRNRRKKKTGRRSERISRVTIHSSLYSYVPIATTGYVFVVTFNMKQYFTCVYLTC
ncbi:unnamed protein product, partial [Hymenolepis diminuta]